MNFANCLWDKFALVDKHNNERRKVQEDFVSLLKARMASEDTYGKELERLAGHQFFTSQHGTLTQTIAALKNSFLNKSMQAKFESDQLQKMIEQTSDLLSHHTSVIRKTAGEGRKIDAEIAVQLRKLHKTKEKYIKSCKKAEDLTIALESSADQRNKLINRFINSKKGVDDSIKQYQGAIESLNAYIRKNDSFMEKVFEIYQKQEEQWVMGLQKSLNSYIERNKDKLGSLQYDNDNLNTALEKVSPDLEIKSIIEKCGGYNGRRPYIEFESYQGTHPSYKNLGTNSPIATVPHAQGSVKTVLPGMDVDQQEAELEQLWKVQMETILNWAWGGMALENDKQIQFNNIIRDNIGRKLWAQWMKAKKDQGQVNLPRSSFEILSQLMINVLNESERQNDVRTVKQCIIFAQQFYTENMGIKENFQSVIMHHFIWKNLDVWEEIVELAISDESKSANSSFSEPEETKEGIDKNTRTVVFAQLNSYAYMMINYNIDLEDIKSLMVKFINRFEFSEAEHSTIISTIEKFYELKHPKNYAEIVAQSEPEVKRAEDPADSFALGAIAEVSEYSDDEVDSSPVKRWRALNGEIPEDSDEEDF